MSFVLATVVQAARSAEIDATFIAVLGLIIAALGLIIALITHAIVISYRGGQLTQKVTSIGDELQKISMVSVKQAQEHDVRLRELENSGAELAVMLRGIADNAKEIERLRMWLQDMNSDVKGLILHSTYERPKQ